MKANDLLTIWGAPEAPNLTAKQISIRLPIIVAAKISALCDLYPRKTKTEIIGDLLTTALEQLEENFPKIKGQPMDQEGLTYEDLGTRQTYLRLANKYLRQLEKDAGVKEPIEFNSEALIFEDHH